MSSDAGSLAIFGLFLLLAFVIPGLVYTVFLYVYFPELKPGFLDVNTLAGLFGIVVILGLLITAVCFFIEKVILEPHLYPKIHVTGPNIPLLGRIESQGKSAVYLNQVFGQYIMHLNIGLGVFLLWGSYIFARLWDNYHSVGLPANFSLNVSGGLVVWLVNLYIALFVFTKFAGDASSAYLETMNPNSKQGRDETQPKKAVVFDLDNTLVKTYEVYYEANQVIFKWTQQIGGATQDEEVSIKKIFARDRELKKELGTPNYPKKKLLEAICKDMNIKQVGIQEALSNYEKALEKMPELKENAYRTIAKLCNENWSLFLLSEGDEIRIRSVAKHYKFDEIFDDVIPLEHKTQDELIKLARKMTKAGYLKRFLVGDSLPNDIMLGNACGFKTIWYPSSWEEGKPQAGSDWPNYKIKDLFEIVAILSEKQDTT